MEPACNDATRETAKWVALFSPVSYWAAICTHSTQSRWARELSDGMHIVQLWGTQNRVEKGGEHSERGK